MNVTDMKMIIGNFHIIFTYIKYIFCESTIDHVKLTSKLDALLTKHRHSIHVYNII